MPLQVLQDELNAVSVLLRQKREIREQIVEAALFAAVLPNVVVDQACDVKKAAQLCAFACAIRHHPPGSTVLAKAVNSPLPS